jgi:hypothetical protein
MVGKGGWCARRREVLPRRDCSSISQLCSVRGLPLLSPYGPHEVGGHALGDEGSLGTCTASWALSLVAHWSKFQQAALALQAMLHLTTLQLGAGLRINQRWAKGVQLHF